MVKKTYTIVDDTKSDVTVDRDGCDIELRQGDDYILMSLESMDDLISCIKALVEDSGYA